VLLLLLLLLLMVTASVVPGNPRNSNIDPYII
jgi:hypothetical protein